MFASSDLADARESLAYWEDRERRLPRLAFRARREAREMAARCRARVVAAERADYGHGLVGAALLVLTERRLPEVARGHGRVALRRVKQVAVATVVAGLALTVLAVVAVVELVASLV
jgi:CelD/BcsL family acetyltransferase involved in cellulose biosynthesis